MAKRFSASDMLKRSQTQPRSEAPREASPAIQVTGPVVNVSTRQDVNESTSTPLQGTTALAASARYQKTAVFFAPHQKAWLRQVSRELPEGLSTSDVVRLAVERLLEEVGNGLDLEPALVAQARREAERYAGRRNSGVNQLAAG